MTTAAEHVETVAKAPSRWWRRRRLLRIVWLCALACVVAASLVPSDSAAKQTMDALPISDKLGHFVAYLLLAALPVLTESRRWVALNALGIVMLGCVLEYWQIRYVGRGFDGWDVAANVAGVLSALAAEPRLRLIQSKGA